MTPSSLPSLRATWAPLDFGLYAFLAINPLALGLWIFSLAPLVGGNILIAVVLTCPVVVLGAVVYGSLAGRWPWTGGDYAWQTRLLDRKVGAVLALTSWWIVVATLAPVYGNVILVQVADPLLVETGWDGVASWFHGRDGVFAASLIAITVATAFVGLGMRRAAIVQRAVVVVGGISLVAILGLLLTHSPQEFSNAFDEASDELYGVGGTASSQIRGLGNLDARVTDVDPVNTLTLVPLVLLFALWIGWAGPLAGEIRTAKPRSVRPVLIRAAVASTVTSLMLFVALGRGANWDLWNEANNLYWGTIYGTTATTPLPTWPNPVVFATWLTESTLVRILLVAGMAAWVVGWTMTLFLGATRVLLAAAHDHLLPAAVARTTGDTVPIVALALLVVPACGLAALDAYWDTFGLWTSSAVLALALTTVGSSVTALLAFRREHRSVALAAALFAVIVALVIGVWIADPVFGIRTVGSLAFITALYVIAVGYAWARQRHVRAATLGAGDA